MLYTKKITSNHITFLENFLFSEKHILLSFIYFIGFMKLFNIKSHAIYFMKAFHSLLSHQKELKSNLHKYQLSIWTDITSINFDYIRFSFNQRIMMEIKSFSAIRMNAKLVYLMHYTLNFLLFNFEKVMNSYFEFSI